MQLIIGNGKGIEVKEFEKSSTYFILFFLFFLLSMYLIQILFDSYFIEDRFSSNIPEYIINFIGAKIISVNIPIVEFPLYVKIIALGSSLSLVIYSIYQTIKRSKF